MYSEWYLITAHKRCCRKWWQVEVVEFRQQYDEILQPSQTWGSFFCWLRNRKHYLATIQGAWIVRFVFFVPNKRKNGCLCAWLCFIPFTLLKITVLAWHETRLNECKVQNTIRLANQPRPSLNFKLNIRSRSFQAYKLWRSMESFRWTLWKIKEFKHDLIAVVIWL